MPTPRDDRPAAQNSPPDGPAAEPGGPLWPLDAGQAGDQAELARLLDDCQRGDRGAFRTLYGRFVRTVHGIALAGIGPEEAADVTQEVFLRVHRGLDSVRDGQALPGWICSVARNMVVDFVRRRKRRPQPLRLVEEPAAGAADDDAVAGRVLELIRALPEAYRETLVLRLVEGLTGPEIAARTGMTHGSVRVNLSRGMARLRAALAEGVR